MLAALASGIIELLSPMFGFVFVSVAALVAAGLAGLGASFSLQLVAFSVVLLACLVFVRPRFARQLEAQGVATRTEALVGRVGIVTLPLDPRLHTGRVEVAGQDWAARCPVALPSGAAVRVAGADGIVLEVLPDEESPEGALPEN